MADVIFQWESLHCIRDHKRRLNTILLAKTWFYAHASVGKLDFLYVGWTKRCKWVVKGTRPWKNFVVTPTYWDYMKNYQMLLEQRNHILVTVLTTVLWLVADQIHNYLVIWLDFFLAFM